MAELIGMYPLTAVGNLALAGVGLVFLGVGILSRVFRDRDGDRDRHRSRN